jgi:hypothetical protein
LDQSTPSSDDNFCTASHNISANIADCPTKTD